MSQLRNRNRFLALFAVLPAFLGCFVDGFRIAPFTLPPPERVVAQVNDEFVLFTEEGLSDAFWLEITRTQDSSVVGGYLSTNEPVRNAIVLLVPGTSFASAEGSTGVARDLHYDIGPALQDEGYITWSLAYQQCGAPYGEDDLRDILQAIDWLDAEGKQVLGVDRIHLVGYSLGGGLVGIANRSRDVDSIVSLAGVVSPNQFSYLHLIFPFVRILFPDNEGICQLIHSIEVYGGLGSVEWFRFDVLTNLNDMRGPMLFVSGEDDEIVSPSITRQLETSYLAGRLLGIGSEWPEIEFEYIPNVGHTEITRSREAAERILDYLAEF
jgi:pimeloyl-ACP methyl ester carboxylesterase